MEWRAAAAGVVAGISMLTAGCGAGATTTGGSGATLFTAHCSVCHSLDGRDHPRLQGGDLLGFRASRAELQQFVAEMPVVHRPLTRAQLRTVVDYVRAAEQRSAR